jgi:hypothetical protein
MASDPAGTDETLAAVRCVECGRPREREEGWQLYLADIGEVAIYCPDCVEREFGSKSTRFHETRD